MKNTGKSRHKRKFMFFYTKPNGQKVFLGKFIWIEELYDGRKWRFSKLLGSDIEIIK